MRLVHVGVLTVAVSLGGCLDLLGEGYQPVCGDGMIDSTEGYENCDDGNRIDDDGCSATCRLEPMIALAWQFADTQGAMYGCPAGFDTIEATTVVRGSATVTTFPCADRVGLVHLDSNGFYRVTLRVTDGVGGVWASSLLQQVSVQDGTRNVSVGFLVDGGHVTVGWHFYETATATAHSCGTGNLAPAVISATPTSGGAASERELACSELFGSLAVPAGSYTIVVTASDGEHTGTLTRNDVVVTAPNGVVDLGQLRVEY